MSDEPMEEEEEDSFCRPVPFSAPFVRPSLPTVSEQNDEDPDSDDSFDNFAATQSTVESSTKSTASSTQSGSDPKTSLPGPSSVQPNIPLKAIPKINQQNGESTPAVPLSQKVTQNPGISQRIIPSTRPQSVNSHATHPAIKLTKAIDLSQKSKAPTSPNSLARHRSANSGLRNGNIGTLPVKGMMLSSKMSPNEPRPSTPSGEVKMLRDMLDTEKHRTQKMQFDFQKDIQKTLENHRREMENRDAMLRNKEKEIEILKASLACQKATTPKSVNIISKSPMIPISGPVKASINNFPSISNGEVRKIYPKIPCDPFRRTPHRVQLPESSMSAFRHPNKDDDDDTFQLDVSFEPSATSTPKIPGILRTGIRRPLCLDDPFSVARGEPTPKRKPVFEEERKKWTMEEMDEEVRKIWGEMEDSESTYNTLFSERKKVVPQEKNVVGEDDMSWLNSHLLNRVRQIGRRREEKSRMISAKVKAKMIQQAEQCSLPDTKCSICQLEERVHKANTRNTDEKEWMIMEAQRVELAKRGAEEMRAKQYSDILRSVNIKGIEALSTLSQKKLNVEKEYTDKTFRIKKRTLEEVREDKKDEWRNAMMNELREHGEMEAQLEVEENGRNEDYVWTSESEDEDWEFPQPYNICKASLCAGCAHRQKLERRVTKRERERKKLKLECLQEYGAEVREKLRNMSILTKSKMEAAEKELNRHVDEVLASSRIFNDEDEETF